MGMVFWDVTLCRFKYQYQHFRGACCFHLQGQQQAPTKHLYPYNNLYGVISWKMNLQHCFEYLVSCMYWGWQWRTKGGGFGGGVQTPLKFQSLDKAELNSQFCGKYICNNLIRIHVSLFANWVEPLTRWLLPSDPHSLYPLNLLNPHPKKIPGYATGRWNGQ
jgi:hypothetical protein